MTRHLLPRLEQTQILQSSLLLPASSAQKITALKPTSSSAMQIDGKLWLSNEAEKNGNEKLVSFSADLFQIGSLATVLSSNPFAWWMVPQHKWTEKLPRWWQPALNSCLGDEPEAPAQPLNTEWGRLTTGKEERNTKNQISLTQGSLTEWIYGKLWLSITLKLMFSKSRIRPFEISSFPLHFIFLRLSFVIWNLL